MPNLVQKKQLWDIPECRDCFTSRSAEVKIVSLSKGVFEPRTSTGSEDFSLLICLDDIKFVLLSFFTIIVTIWLKIWAKQSSKNKKRATSGWRVSLKNVVA